MDDHRVLQVLRCQAWDRAKGELQSMLVTFYGSGQDNKFKKLSDAIYRFVEEIEENGLQE